MTPNHTPIADSSQSFTQSPSNQHLPSTSQIQTSASTESLSLANQPYNPNFTQIPALLPTSLIPPIHTTLRISENLLPAPIQQPAPPSPQHSPSTSTHTTRNPLKPTKS